ncbi:MAG TPA: hypothetical protein PKC28_03590 [Bdellovibrionales bacterium]|nr:hypothetical protein [Bdellovibrionales bacterium]
MRRIILAASILTLSLTGCGGGGGGGGSAGSSSSKGTGYLKIALPELPNTSASSLDVGSFAQVITAGSYAEAPMILNSVLIDQNTPEACVGSSANVPFIICMVESFGINSVGTYTGAAPNGSAAQAVVANLTADPDGYTLAADVTLVASGEKVFRYKATADGKKGYVEIKPNKIFPVTDEHKEGIRLTWNTTTDQEHFLEYTYHYSGTSSQIVSEQIHYIAALVDNVTGVADIAARSYMFVDNLSGFQEANSKFSQTRVGKNRAIVAMSACTEGSSPVEGSECFAVSTGTMQELEAGEPLTCGTVPTTGNIELTVLDSMALSNATQGSWAYTSTFAGDATCDALRSAVNGADAFVIRLDKDAAPAATVAGLFHIMRGTTYGDLKLLSSGSFLP